MFLGVISMGSHPKHEAIVNGFHSQFKAIFDTSKQGMYLYMDDTHKVCNKKFSDLLGFRSPQEFAKIKGSFLAALVDKKSQHMVVVAYTKAVDHAECSTIPVTWKTKKGKKVSTQVTFVPVMYEDHAMALHFIEKS